MVQNLLRDSKFFKKKYFAASSLNLKNSAPNKEVNEIIKDKTIDEIKTGLIHRWVKSHKNMLQSIPNQQNCVPPTLEMAFSMVFFSKRIFYYFYQILPI